MAAVTLSSGRRLNPSEGLEDRIIPQKLSIVPIRIARQDLIDLLGDDAFRRMCDAALGSRIRQSPGRFSQDAQLSIELPNRQQPRIRNDLVTIKSDRDHLPIHLEQFPLPRTSRILHRTPPVP
ncbi:MAG: hypothetical protein R3C01_05100 [Planctomycetaceae bacterium]